MDFKLLYGEGYNPTTATKRFTDLAVSLKRATGKTAERFYSSSGRAEILGNHTDHNNGKVIVSAISCDIVGAARAEEDTITVISDGYKPIVVKLNDTAPVEKERGTSTALVKGVVQYLRDKGYQFGGFTMYSSSNVFKGAGVSSSAAFEVLICEVINDMYLGGRLTAVEKAVASQYAEAVYFGKPCGLLDQCGISIGSLTKLDFQTPTAPVITKLPPIQGYSLIITNTGGNHAHLTKHYAAIRTEMHAVANYFGKQVLREVDKEQFYGEFPTLTRKLSSRAILRAMHYFDENERVDNAEKAVISHNINDFLSCVDESGTSSMNLLQNCFVPGSDSQPVVLGIEASRRCIKDGAVRIHGGGFAGSILAVVNDGEAEGYIARMQRLFGNDNVFKASVREKGTIRVDF